MISKTIAVLAAGHTPPTRKTITTIAALGIALGALLAPALSAWAQESVRLEGAWIYAAPGRESLGTFIFSPTDSSATNATMSGSRIIEDHTYGGAFPNAQYETPFVGQATLTSSNAGVYTVLSYGMRTGSTGPEIVYILVDSGSFTNIAPGKSSHAFNISFYLPSQDTQGIGLPDRSQAPIACHTGNGIIDTRIPMFAPCAPRPALSLSHQPDNSLAIGWPASATGFTLESAASLPSTNWVSVPGVQSNRAVIQPTAPKRFYRLEKQ